MYLKRVFQLGALLWISIVTSSLIDGELGYLSDLAILLLAALLFNVILITTLAGIRKYGFVSRSWPLSPVLCVLFLFSIHRVGVYVTEWRFQWQLPEYTAAVDGLKTGDIEIERDNQRIDIRRFGHPPGRAKGVDVTRCGQQNLIVRFMIPTRGGAVGPHWGYIYDDCSDTSDTVSETTAPAGVYMQHESYYHIQGPWYEFYRP
jgi:hypothetical protein